MLNIIQRLQYHSSSTTTAWFLFPVTRDTDLTWSCRDMRGFCAVKLHPGSGLKLIKVLKSFCITPPSGCRMSAKSTFMVINMKSMCKHIQGVWSFFQPPNFPMCQKNGCVQNLPPLNSPELGTLAFLGEASPGLSHFRGWPVHDSPDYGKFGGGKKD